MDKFLNNLRSGRTVAFLTIAIGLGLTLVLVPEFSSLGAIFGTLAGFFYVATWFKFPQDLDLPKAGSPNEGQFWSILHTHFFLGTFTGVGLAQLVLLLL